MPKADDRLDSKFLELPRHHDVPTNRLLIVNSRTGLHPRPLDAKPVILRTDLLQRLQVFIEVGPAEERISARRRLLLRDHNIPVGREVGRRPGLNRRVLVLVARSRYPPCKLLRRFRRRDLARDFRRRIKISERVDRVHATRDKNDRCQAGSGGRQSAAKPD